MLFCFYSLSYSSWISIQPQGSTSASTWYAITTSNTGQYVSAVISSSYSIWVSVDYGQSWTYPSIASAANGFTCIAMSGSGKTQSVVGGSNNMYLSSDYGSSWTIKTPSNCQGVAMSFDGVYHLTGSGAINYLYVSTNSGNTWNSLSYTGSWISFTVSQNGNYMTACALGGYLMTSSNYGATFTIRGPNRVVSTNPLSFYFGSNPVAQSW